VLAAPREDAEQERGCREAISRERDRIPRTVEPQDAEEPSNDGDSDGDRWASGAGVVKTRRRVAQLASGSSSARMR
jgi:hypothetical protein